MHSEKINPPPPRGLTDKPKRPWRKPRLLLVEFSILKTEGSPAAPGTHVRFEGSPFMGIPNAPYDPNLS